MQEKKNNFEDDNPDYNKSICGVCSLEPECLSWNLESDAAEKLFNIVRHLPIMDDGAHLFQTGDNLTSVYAVRQGAFKTYAYDADGHEHVLGFVLAGEILGFDGVYSRRHGCNAVAIKDSAVCALPYIDLAALMGTTHRLRQQILYLASRDFSHDRINASLAPEARVANFLINLVQRSRHVDGFELQFELPMTPIDIAGYLRIGLVETQNSLSYFEHKKLIAINSNDAKVLDLEGLREIADNKKTIHSKSTS